MTASKIFKIIAAHQATLRKVKEFLKFLSVWSYGSMHTVQQNREIFASYQFFDRIEIKQLLHKFPVSSDRVYDLNLKFWTVDEKSFGSQTIKLYVWNLWNSFEFCNFFGALKDSVGDRFGGRTAISAIEFNTKISIWATRVVTCGQEDCSNTLPSIGV